MAKPDSMIVNLSDLDVKRRLMQKIGALSGLHEITIKARKRTRSLDQNAYYFAACVTPFREWITENWGERCTLDQAHETLKLALLDIPTVQGIAVMPSSKILNTQEFSDYIERAAQFLAVKCGIVVLSPELFYEAPERNTRAKPKAQQAQQPSAKLKAGGQSWTSQTASVN